MSKDKGAQTSKRKRKQTSEQKPNNHDAGESRLKRRRSSDKGKAVVARLEDSAPIPRPPLFRDDEVTQLSSIVRECLGEGSKKIDRMESCNFNSLVKVSADLLGKSSEAPLSLIKQVPNLPIALSHAAKQPTTSTYDLIRCFLYLSTKVLPSEQQQLLPSVQQHQTEKKSIYSNAEEDKAASQRASKWVLNNLSQLLSTKSEKSIHSNAFIEPWHSVHNALLHIQCKNVKNHISLLHQNTPKENGIFVHKLVSLFARRLPNGSPTIQQLFSSLLESISCLPHPISYSEDQNSYVLEKDAITLLHLNIESGTVHGAEKVKAFDCLSVDAQVELLRSSNEVYSHYIKKIRETSSWESDIENIQSQTEVLGKAAVEHVQIHWKLMDHVRHHINISTNSVRANKSQAAASLILPLGTDRVWMKSIFEYIATQLEGISIRFPPKVRHEVDQLLMLHRAFYDGNNIEAGILGVKTLYQMFDLDNKERITKNWRAVLVILESVIEHFVWTCGWRQRHAKRIEKNDSDELANMCHSIIFVMYMYNKDTKQNEFNTKRNEFKKLLTGVWTKKAMFKSFPKLDYPISRVLCISMFSAVDTKCRKRFQGDIVKRSPSHLKARNKHESAAGLKSADELELKFGTLEDP